MGGSGCGKSTLLRHLIGLMAPAQGDIFIDGTNYWTAPPEDQERMKRRFGVLFQSGGLWSSMTLAENVALPLQAYTSLAADQIGEIVSLKLALVGLAGCHCSTRPAPWRVTTRTPQASWDRIAARTATASPR